MDNYTLMFPLTSVNKVISENEIYSTMGMFLGLKSKDLDLSEFDTSNVTDMSEIFNGCDVLKIVYIRTQEDGDKFKNISGSPEDLNFIIKNN